MHEDLIEHLKSLVTSMVSSPAQQVQWNDKETVRSPSQIKDYHKTSTDIKSYITRLYPQKTPLTRTKPLTTKHQARGFYQISMVVAVTTLSYQHGHSHN
jgi:hypothetical protein